MWDKNSLGNLLLDKAIVKLSHCSSLEDFRFSGQLKSQSLRCLRECMVSGFEGLKRLEITVHPDLDKKYIEELMSVEKTSNSTGQCYRKILIVN